MAWIIETLEIADKAGHGTGRYRRTATSDEDGGGPYGDPSHDHGSVEEAYACERCDEYVAGIAGMPSKKERRAREEKRERAEYERLKNKLDPYRMEGL